MRLSTSRAVRARATGRGAAVGRVSGAPERGTEPTGAPGERAERGGGSGFGRGGTPDPAGGELGRGAADDAPARLPVWSAAAVEAAADGGRPTGPSVAPRVAALPGSE
ncbi:MAG: hypothetical protein NVSMB55_00340 [Mycobacteriales bacterium]